MNIETSNINYKSENRINKSAQTKNDSSAKFTDELKELEKQVPTNDEKSKETKGEDKQIDEAIEDLNSTVKELNQSEDKSHDSVKDKVNSADKNNVINNDFNIQENKEIMPQMNPNMNFGSDGQPFSSFMNNENGTKSQQLSNSVKDLAEEAAILSTMAENIALANRNMPVENQEEKTVTKNDGIKKIDIQTGITIERVVKFDSIIMNQADVEVFANLVENKTVDMNNLAPEATKKSIEVSKTLADMLLKAKETNQPLRIDFDNNISVIIRISRDGKLSAEFLPSSQVAEAYLKENLPILKQRFDEKNLEYENLSHRERRDNNREHNNKKGRNDE